MWFISFWWVSDGIGLFCLVLVDVRWGLLGLGGFGWVWIGVGWCWVVLVGVGWCWVGLVWAGECGEEVVGVGLGCRGLGEEKTRKT